MTKADKAAEAQKAALAALQTAVAKSKVFACSTSQHAAVFAALAAKWSKEFGQHAAVFAALAAKWSKEFARVAVPAIVATRDGVQAAAICAADGATAISAKALIDACCTWRTQEPRNYVADGVITLLGARVLVALNAIADAALHELLHSPTALARSGLAVTVTQGWLAAYIYRGALLRDLPKDRSEQLQQIAQNSLKLPASFWVPTALSGLVSLHASKELSASVVRKVLNARLRVLMLLFAAYMGMAPKAQEQARRSFVQLQDSIPPEVTRALTTTFQNCQVATHWTCRNAGRAAKAAASATVEGQARLRAKVSELRA